MMPRGRIHQLFHHQEELLLLHGLGQEGRSALFHGALAMFGARSRSDHQDRYPASHRILPQMRHQFVAVHARHFNIGNNQMTTHLRNQLRGLQPVRSKLHGIPGLLKNSAHEFADADGIIRDDHDFFRSRFIHRFGGNAAGSDRQGSGSENASRVGRRDDNVHFRRGRASETVHVHKQNQTAIGGNRGSGEKLYAAQVLAEVLDDHFVLAENFFDDHAHLAASGPHDHHIHVAVNRLDRRKTERGVQTNYFRDDASHFREQLPADVFYFSGAQPANFFHDGEGHRQDRGARTHKQRLRNNQRERNFYSEAGALPCFAMDFYFTVQGVNVAADNVESHTAPRDFGLGRRRRETRMKQESPQLVFR